MCFDIEMEKKKIFIGVLSLCCFSVIYFHFNVNDIYSYYTEHKVCNVWGINKSIVSEISLQQYVKKDFQSVSNRNDLYVYSAFYDGLDKIRLIGISLNVKNTVICLLRYQNISEKRESIEVVKGYISSQHVWQGTKFTSVYFICYLCGHGPPDSVSIVHDDIDVISNIVPVHRVFNNITPDIKFTFCLSPLHGTMGDLEFIEWIEMNRILGIQKFIMYIHDANSNTTRILDYYTSLGVVETMPWLNIESLKTEYFFYFAQLSALNDCLYRMKGLTEYIVVSDLDEFIIPQNKVDYTLTDLIQRIHINNITALLFSNTFYRRDEISVHFENPSSELVTQSWLLRYSHIYTPPDRSKYIVKSNHIVTLDVHDMNAVNYGNEYVVPSNIGLLHHYRRSIISEKYWFGKPKLFKDTTALKYGEQLSERVRNISKILNINYV